MEYREYFYLLKMKYYPNENTLFSSLLKALYVYLYVFILVFLKIVY